MEDHVVNATMTTPVNITQAQIVTTAVIGSILVILVVSNLVMFSIYKKLTNDHDSTNKSKKRESVQLYQVKPAGEYNSVSHSSHLNKSYSRENITHTISLNGEDNISGDYSPADRSLSRDRSLETASGLEVSPQLDTSFISHQFRRNENLEKSHETISNLELNQSTDSSQIETEAQIHLHHLSSDRKSSGFSDVHRYRSTKYQMWEKPSNIGPRQHQDAPFPIPAGITREMHITMKCSQGRHCHQQVRGYVDLTDFENDTDTDIQCMCSMASVELPSMVVGKNLLGAMEPNRTAQSVFLEDLL
ncbi:uncharacterized protein LOC124268082 [Haliotis rubra]|uniref:uncharacterized protein LOC124268082 n=1 Tax=Haliotis rubra TaxID=36100 RepID=UPI001EE51137|nr:uncharacterized protein LOC124268082 [Haliotis rubra]